MSGSTATASTTAANPFGNAPPWRQILFSIRQRNERRDAGDGSAKMQPANRSPPMASGLSILTCCVSPQSDIGRVRIDRSMIGRPSDFRHIGHMGANDLSGSYNFQEEALNSLLRSKGDDECRIPVPANFRAKDLPISAAN